MTIYIHTYECIVNHILYIYIGILALFSMLEEIKMSCNVSANVSVPQSNHYSQSHYFHFENTVT